MELREVRTLLEIVSRGSIAAAAQSLHLSPAALHKQLKNLEREWDMQLYEKRGRRLEFTAATRLVLPYLREIVSQDQALHETIREWKGLRRGLVRIGAGPTLGSYVLPLLLKTFREKHAGIDVVVETGSSQSLLEGLRKGALDLALMLAAGADSPEFVVLADWEFEAVIISKIPHAPRRCHLRSLRRHPFILYQAGSRLETLIDGYFARYGFRPEAIMRFDNAEALKAMVAMGLGISMVPLWTVEDDVHTGKLSLIRQREQPLISRFALVGRRTGFVGGPVQAFTATARRFERNTSRWLYHGLSSATNHRVAKRRPSPGDCAYRKRRTA